MKDDNMQGILFSHSPVLRFKQVPPPPTTYVGKAKKLAKIRLITPIIAAYQKKSGKDTTGSTQPGDYIEYSTVD